MTNPTAHQPGAGGPSTGRLLRSLAVTLVVAAAIVVTTVLPAEYGVDPTGVGQILGLKEMGEIKKRLVAEAAADSAIEADTRALASRADAGTMFDSIDVILAPGQGSEVKMVMQKDATVNFSWSANRGAVNYDTHADSPTIRYHGYAKGSGVKADSGTLTAAFDGQHGWFWRNRGADTVVVTLYARGHFVELTRTP